MATAAARSGAAAAHESEVLLRGAVAESDRENLVLRLDSLCGDANRAELAYHEKVYWATGVAPGGAGRGTTVLRIRKHTAGGADTILYTGPLHRTARDPVPTRRAVTVDAEGDSSALIEALGFTFDYQLYRRGISWKFRDTIDVSITEVCRVADEGAPADSAVPLTKMHLVELSARPGPSRTAVKVGEEMLAFGEQLRPLVVLDTDFAQRAPT